ncbi:MAG TPA: hypothetical protein VGK61_06090 [Planctomycetota bacterium]|jgi:hypothetical protein
MAELNARMEGFARQQLGLGKGRWWIVDELVRHGHVDPQAAKSLVDNIAPKVYRNLARRRLPFLIMGQLVTAIGVLWMAIERSDISSLVFGLAPMVIGAFLVAYGWPSLAESTTDVLAPGNSGPVRLGLTLRAEPFDKM